MKHLPDMAVFAVVVEVRSMSAAARQLGLTTSAVSRSIHRLETHFGGQLLHRLHRTLAVTELGAVVRDACTAIVERMRDIDALARHYASTPAGCLRISAAAPYGRLYLADRLPAFLAAWPDLDARVVLTGRPVDPVRDDIDVAIHIGRDLPPDAASRLLQRTSHVLAASPSYLAARGTPQVPSALEVHTLLMDTASPAAARLLLRRDAEYGQAAPRRRLACDDGAAAIGAALRGLGICRVPDFAVRRELAHGSLVRVLGDWSPAEDGDVGIHALFSPVRPMPTKVRAFVDFLVACHQEDTS